MKTILMNFMRQKFEKQDLVDDYDLTNRTIYYAA